ncbi:hypothetical protein N0V88_008035 [Collariella sp. IMI 366227]|nr:hypothetical protein N0V88_008035 [Collariella sp. IMI 366227]
MPFGGAPQGFMDYLAPLMEAQPPGSALQYAFNSCAFALLGNRSRADGVGLAQLSLKEHILALAQAHKALGDPAHANTDATLVAVLMLCLYEVSRSLSSGLPFPFGADWWMSGGDTTSLFATSQHYALRFSELRTDITRHMTTQPRTPESIAAMQVLADRAQCLDTDIAH